MNDVFLEVKDLFDVLKYYNIDVSQKHLDVILQLTNNGKGDYILEQQQRAGIPWQGIAGIAAGALTATFTKKQCERITYCLCYPEEENGRTTVYELTYNQLLTIYQKKYRESRPSYKQKKI